MQFLMRNQNIILVLWFEQVIIAHYQVFGERVFKKMQKLRKYFDSIWLISQRKQRRNPNYLLPKWSAKKALQILKVSSNSKEVAGLTGDFWWKHPYKYLELHVFITENFKYNRDTIVVKRRGHIRPQISPPTFSRRNGLKLNNSKDFLRVNILMLFLMWFDSILNSRYDPSLYSTFVYIFTSYFDNISRKAKYLFVIFLS